MSDERIDSALASAKRLLIFGGSFDPPHRGHLDLPELVRVAVGADLVVYVPARRSPFKTGKRDYVPASDEQRVAMLRLALADRLAGPAPTAVIYEGELLRPPPSYTVETVRALKEMIDPQTQLRLLIGADQARLFDHWRESAWLVVHAEPVVVARPPDTVESLADELDATWEVRIIPTPLMPYSSTQVRQRARRGDSLEGLVTPEVAAYIEAEGLYRDDPSEATPEG